MTVDSRPSTPTLSDGERVPTLKGLLLLWWRMRLSILFRLGLGAVVVIGAMAVAYFFRPSQREAQLEFRLLFKGVEHGLYPNDMRFTPADIVTPAVLEEVYQQEKLDGVIPYQQFQSAFAVLPRNPALEEFREEFGGRLLNPKLNPVERAKVEDEYASRLQALRNGEFVLVGRPAGGWPDGLKTDILRKILDVWAQKARAQGVFRFDLDVYSTNIIADLQTTTNDYLMLVDRIRVISNRVLDNIQRLESVPGASLVRAGPRQVSLAEVKVQLQDDLHYKLGLLEVPVFGLGLYQNRSLSDAYIDEQLFRLAREMTAVQSRMKSVERALARYAGSSTPLLGSSGTGLSANAGSALMPQLSESFIDRMLEMASTQVDIEFRQDLSHKVVELGKELARLQAEQQVYENMRRRLNNIDASMESRRPALEEWAAEQSKALVETLRNTLDNIQALYQEISLRSLEPTTIYVAPKPVEMKRVSPVSLGRFALLLFMLSSIYTCVVLFQIGRAAVKDGRI